MNIKQTAWVFIVNDSHEVLLHRRLNTWYQQDKLGLIGGNVDAGETPQEAAIRETKEETSLILTLEDLKLLTVTEEPYEDSLYRNSYYIINKWSGTPENVEPERCGGLSWHSLTSLPEDTIASIRKIADTYLS